MARRRKSITETGPKALRGIRNSDLYGGGSSIFSDEELADIQRSYVDSSQRAYYGYKGALGNAFTSPALYETQPYAPDDPRNDVGFSAFDSNLMLNATAQDITDERANNQPWYSQIINGTLKGAITAGTTFINGTLGLIAGLGQGIVNLTDDDPNTGFLSGIWDNGVTNFTQKISDWQEKALPNYYTTEEQTSPWYENIFTANFLGDKFIKNLGFTIGAFYGGGIYSKALEAVSWMPGMARAAVASGLSAINEGSIEALNNSRDWYNAKVAEINAEDEQDMQGIRESFATRAQQLKDKYDATAGNFIRTVDGGYIDPALQEYQQGISQLEAEYRQIASERKQYKEKALAKLNADRAKMGNADLLMNIPILTASNMFQFGKYLAGGAKTATRTSKVVNTTGKSIQENIGKNAAMYGVKSQKWKPYVTGFGRALSEGNEELTQKMAAEISGNYYGTDVMNYYKALKDPDAELETLNWINSFKEGVVETVGNAASWEEFSIGFLTGALGVPVFGKAFTQNAYIGKGKFVGVAGGMAEAFSEYNQQQKRDQEIADALNARIQSPEFLNYYQGMIRHRKEQTEMDKAINAGNIREYKDHEHNQLVSDITLWDNAGKIDEIREYIKAESELSDENLDDIIKQTTTKVNENPAFIKEINKLQSDINKWRVELQEANADPEKHKRKIQNRLNSIANAEKRLAELDAKKDDILGPFVDSNGNVKDREEIKQQLQDRANDILSTIDRYLKIKEEIDSSTNAVLSREQLAHLTWLKSHKENWELRNQQMSKELKETVVPAILESLRDEVSYYESEIEKAQKSRKKKGKEEKVKELTDNRDFANNMIDSLQKMAALDDDRFGKGLAITPQVAQMIKLAMTKPDVAKRIGASEIFDYMRKVDDIVANVASSLEYNMKLKEYLQHPGMLEEDIQKADEEVAKEFVKKQTEKIKKDIKDKVTTVSELRDIVADLPNSDAIVDELINDEDENLSKLAKAYKDISLLAKVGNEYLSKPDTNEQVRLGREGAALTLNKILNDSNSVEDAIDAIKKEIDSINDTVENKGDNWEQEEKVGEALQQVLDNYSKAKDGRARQEPDKNKPEKSAKKESKSANQKFDEMDEGQPSKKDEGEEKEITIHDVIEAYERKIGKLSDLLKAQLINKAENNDLEDFLKGTYLDIYESLKNGTLDDDFDDIGSEDNDNEDEGEKEVVIDFDELNKMSNDEAIAYLESLDTKKLDKGLAKKISKLIAKMKKNAKELNGVEDGNSDDTTAEHNVKISNDPAFRSWGKYAKYMFKQLSDKKNREAVYNTDPEAQDYLKALDELGAFEFVENGSLGRIFKSNPNVPIRYIKTTDRRINDSILIAIEVNKSILDVEGVKTINTIEAKDNDGNTKTYQVIGALGFNDGDDEAKESYHKLDKALQKERGKDRSTYWVSTKYNNKIREMMTGRMVKSGTVTDSNGKVISTGDVNERPLKEVLHGVTPIIGIYYNDDEGIRVPAKPNGATMIGLNKGNKNNRAGSVWLMVQEADGNYYPKAVSVRRFTDAEYDLEEHKDSPILNQIRNLLEIICDSSKPSIDRFDAKYELQQSLLYFPEDVNILFEGDVVSIVTDDADTTYNNIGSGQSAKDKAQTLMEQLMSEDYNLRFQIVTSSLDDMKYVKQLLDSDILYTDLLQAQNVNASFNLYIHDVLDDDLPLVEKAKEGGKPDRGRGGDINVDLTGDTFVVNRKNYTLNSKGEVLYKNKPVTSEVAEQVKLAAAIVRGEVNPIEGSNNIYVRMANGEEVALKRTNGGGFTVLTQEQLNAAKQKIEDKLKEREKKKAKEALRQKGKKGKESSEPENGEMSDEELLAKARKGMFGVEEENDTLTFDTDNLEQLNKSLDALLLNSEPEDYQQVLEVFLNLVAAAIRENNKDLVGMLDNFLATISIDGEYKGVSYKHIRKDATQLRAKMIHVLNDRNPTFKVGDEITLENYNEKGELVDRYKEKVVEVFDNGGIKISNGVEYSPLSVRKFFGIGKVFRNGANTRIVHNSRLGPNIPLLEELEQEASSTLVDSSENTSGPSLTEVLKENKKEKEKEKKKGKKPAPPPSIGQTFNPIDNSDDDKTTSNLHHWVNAHPMNRAVVTNMVDRDSGEVRFNTVTEFEDYVEGDPTLYRMAQNIDSQVKFNEFVKHIKDCH